MPFTVKVEDHTDEAIDAKDLAIERALEIIGGKMLKYASDLCPVDTGLLRNSITYALDGGGFAVQKYKADKGELHGAYEAEVPKEEPPTRSVVLGTNVEYATFVENGTSKRKPHPFLKPALANHVSEYNKIVANELKKALD